MSTCGRCTNPLCNPTQLPGSVTPCMTCCQPYGDHCYTQHCQMQGMFFSDHERWLKMRAENLARAGAENPGDVMEMCFRATGRIQPPKPEGEQ